MKQALAMMGVLALFGAPVMAQTEAQTEAVTDAWQDLQDRCTAAVLSGDALNVAGLEDRLPDVFYDVVPDDLFFGPRVELKFTAPGRRTVPTGVWGTRDGPFELWLTEYPTAAGFRAICEVRAARGTTIAPAEIAALRSAFETVDAAERTVSRADLIAYRMHEENARGCPVVTSFSTQPGLRSTVSEAAGRPDCGGPSLATDVITPHGVLPPTAGG